MDQQVREIIKINDDIIRFDVGGKKFATRKSTLLSVKDTLFYKIVVTEKLNLKEEIFIDRSPKFFGYILDYLRYHTINYSRFKGKEIEELKLEAEYYDLFEIS